MLKRVLTVLAKAVAWWLVLTSIVWTLCYYSLIGFSMGVVIATGAPAYGFTFGLYGVIIAFPVLYWTAAVLGDM